MIMRFACSSPWTCCLLALLALSACGDDDAAQGGSNAGSGPDPFGNSDFAKDGAVPVAHELDGGGGEQLDGCGAEPFVAMQVPVHVLLVIDKSGSMLDTPDGFDDDKWSSMKSSLATSLLGAQDELSLGLMLYPSDGCDVPMDVAVDVAPGAEALPEIADALEEAEPSGGTPTAAALERALAYFQSGAGAALSGEKYVLLATDGGPNCNADTSCEADACTVNLDGECPMGVANCCDPDLAGPGAESGCLDETATTDAIDALKGEGVQTFVVGIPGTEQYASSLDAFAEAGGRPRAGAPPSYYAVDAQGDDPGGLTDVLRAITSSLITSCRLQLGSTPPSLDKLNVEVDGKLVPQSGANGWELDDSTDPPTIELLGETCEQVETEGVQSVEVLFGCPTIVG
jgi:hypothetical protein